MSNYIRKSTVAEKGSLRLVTWADKGGRWYGIERVGCNHRLACFPGLNKAERRRHRCRIAATNKFNELAQGEGHAHS